MVNLWESVSGLPYFLLDFGLALALLVLFNAVYARITPYNELALIRGGNIAAAISLSGAMLGFVLPLASAIAHSVSPLDMLAWGVIALVVQLIVYAVTSRIVPRFREAVEADQAAPALLLASLSVSAGILSAASMSY